MGQIIKTQVEINPAILEEKLNQVINDDAMLEIHNLYAKMMEPYVPFGTDVANLEVTPEYVRYSTPFAHYMYEGKVYGPNIPIIEDGIVVGWFSPPGQTKHPTGADLQYTKPRASAHWDQAMLAERKEEFVKQVEQILERRARELNG